MCDLMGVCKGLVMWIICLMVGIMWVDNLACLQIAFYLLYTFCFMDIYWSSICIFLECGDMRVTFS